MTNCLHLISEWVQFGKEEDCYLFCKTCKAVFRKEKLSTLIEEGKEEYIVHQKVQHLDPATLMAIEIFRKMVRAQNKAETFEKELNLYVKLIPVGDMAEYIRITSHIE
jgi:hypothetical protein